jgi:Leucine-rich repeat (LRR) protein
MKTNIFLPILIAVLLKISCTTAQVLEQDSLALVAFYNSTGGPNWDNNSGWLSGPVSTWYGVTVEGDRVTELDIGHNNLQDSIPIDIGNLTGLKMLIIGYEDGLIGSLPAEIGNLQSLIGLGIGSCLLTGSIPNTIGNCAHLEFINLWENNLTGPIPSEIGNLENLIFLDLHDNQLTGPIPPELGNCTNLWELWLNNNQLSGKLPESIGSFFHNSIQGVSVILDVSNNLLTDSIPFSWADSAIMGGWLDFSGNLFTDIPPWNPNWILNSLRIEENKMTFEDIEPHFVG